MVSFSTHFRLTVRVNMQRHKVALGTATERISAGNSMIAFRWGKGMLGYMAARREWKYFWLGALATVVLCAPALLFAQASHSTPPGRPHPAKRKASKNRPSEQTFVLVGAGDIASC